MGKKKGNMDAKKAKRWLEEYIFINNDVLQKGGNFQFRWGG
jgi:hypothetical protein